MRKIAFVLVGLVLAFGIYILTIVNEKFEFVDQAIIESRVSTDNKSMTAQKIELRKPDNSIEFFKELKMKSEEYWKTIELNKDVYGFQTQKGTLWNKGLTEEQIDSFETELGIEFPEGLKNYYRVMNGVNLPAINIHGDSGEKSTYSNNFYSYPEDITKIKETIQWIYESNNVTAEDLNEKGISRIFPVFGHRFILVDDDDGLILSMYGDDIIYWTDNISKLLAMEIFEGQELPNVYEENQSNIEVNFWLD